MSSHFYSLYYPLPIIQLFLACGTGSIQVQQVQALKYQILPLACASPPKVNEVGVGKNVQNCTVYRCNHHIIGICSSHGDQIDRNCVCKGLSTSICSAACATPVYNREYLNWLYATCIGYSGWNDPGSASVDTLSIGSTTSDYNSEGTNTEKSYDIEATYAIPKCVDRSDSCQGGYVAAWINCIVNASEVYVADNGYTVDY